MKNPIVKARVSLEARGTKTTRGDKIGPHQNSLARKKKRPVPTIQDRRILGEKNGGLAKKFQDQGKGAYRGATTL